MVPTAEGSRAAAVATEPVRPRDSSGVRNRPVASGKAFGSSEPSARRT
jgi:hypothetical protein